MSRLDDIMAAIDAADGFAFQRLMTHMLIREGYPYLNPLPERKDKGQDARTEPALTKVGEKHVSVAISKEAVERKVLHDCDSCAQAGHQIDVFVFCTARPVGIADRSAWTKNVKGKYGWDLVIQDKNWIQTLVEKPEYEPIVDRILNVPPPGGDFLSAVKTAFNSETSRTMHRALPFIKLPVIDEHIDRPEVAAVMAIASARRGALVVGQAGSGKSGIATVAAARLNNQGTPVLYLDARRVVHIHSIAQLGQYFGLRGDLVNAVLRLARAEGCAVIVDQLDSIGALPATRVLAEFLAEVVGHDGIRAVGVCREWDLEERDELRDLRTAAFETVVSEPLSPDAARELLMKVNISAPKPALVELTRNLLNLALVLDVSFIDPKADLHNIQDQLSLWDQYRKSIEDREGASHNQGRAVVGAAVGLAKESLIVGTRIFPLNLPPTPDQERLVSRGVLIADEGQRYRFRHEQVHDYFYAWDAAERRGLMPKQVVGELKEAAARNVLRIMVQIYHQRMPQTAHRLASEADFLKEVLGL